MSSGNPDEYFEYRVSSKFIGEIQIAFSVIVVVSASITIVSFTPSLETALGHDRDTVIGYITFLSLTILVALCDVIFAVILISAANRISLEKCMLWRGSALVTLVLFGMLTIAFMSMLKSFLVILGFLPTLLFKPFALWVVKGFIDELRELENFPSSNGHLPPAKPTLSLQNPRQMKTKTTIFLRKDSAYKPPYVITSKITPIPE